MTKEINIGRQKNIDYAKALAIFFMIFIHVLMYPESNVLSGKYAYFVGEILGGFLAAPVFMFSMGVGMAYSRKQEPNQLIKRGIELIILAYIVNLARSLSPIVYAIVTKDPNSLRKIIIRLFLGDILVFAGLSFVLMGVLKKVVHSNLSIALISMAINLGVTFLPEIITGNLALCLTAGLFIPMQCNELIVACFPLFTWFVYVAIGQFFGTCIKSVENLDSFYKYAGFIGILLLAFAFSAENSIHFDNVFSAAVNGEYYNFPIRVIASIGIVLIEYTIFHFITKHTSEALDAFIFKLSDSINEIYIVSWIIIMDINDLIFGKLFPGDYDFWVYFILFVLTTVISIIFAERWKEHKKKKQLA